MFIISRIIMGSNEVVLVAYSEIGTKGAVTRKGLERLLINNIKSIAEFEHENLGGRIVLMPKDEYALQRLVDEIRYVFGVQYYAKAYRMKFGCLEDVAESVCGFFGDKVNGKTFRVTAKREGNHHFTSIDVQRTVGKALEMMGGIVDFKKYEIEIFVEIRNDECFLYDEVVNGPGGLPIGSAGKVVVLFSGGIDSPVATWMMMKRGCIPVFAFVNLGGEDNKRRVFDVYEKLLVWAKGITPEFIEYDGSEIVNRIKSAVKPSYRQLVLKKAMYWIANELCKKKRAYGIVTGESIGQVSTQTIKNLWVLSKSNEVVVFRPLLGMNKDEIIDIARKIGTFEKSICVGEVCNISKGSVKTNASFWELEQEYEKVKGVVEKIGEERNRLVGRGGEGRNVTMDTYKVIDYNGDTNVTIDTYRVIDHNRDTNVTIDTYKVIDLDKDTIDIDTLDKTILYIIVCKDGVRASLECDMLRLLGYKCISSKVSQLSKILPSHHN
ncbi:MAG: tRNA sulfurtransferase [Candidatus Micrarchaeia archaeon]